jgi:hypothetical protein
MAVEGVMSQPERPKGFRHGFCGQTLAAWLSMPQTPDGAIPGADAH